MQKTGQPAIKSHEDILTMLFERDELSWQTIILELVKSNQMDPWDIDVSLLSKKYLEMLKKLKDLDFRITGKIVLAAAMLLKIKSKRLIGKDLDYLDSLFSQRDEDMEGGFPEEFFRELTPERRANLEQELKLIPRTPQARKRKVSIYDLMAALQKAMEVKKRRVMRDLPPMQLEAPKKAVDISKVIKDVYGRIKSYLSGSNARMTFTHLIPEHASKHDKVYTFIPLLHLSTARKVDLLQEQHFGEIEIQLIKKQADAGIQKELGAEA